MILRPLYCFALFIFFISCKSTKKTQVAATPEPEPVPVVQLDTVQVLSKEPPKKTVYRQSNPRSNDILHTRLEVDFDWTNSRLNGKATLQIKPHFYAVNTLFLDARGMEIKSLEVFEVGSSSEKNKKPGKDAESPTANWKKVGTANHTYENDSLKINLGRTFSASENYFVVIQYIAKPNELKNKGGSNAITEDKGLYFINPHGENPFKMPQIWTQGETQANSVWFPTIDSPNERMTQEILMTVEDRFTTLSNGSLISSVKNEHGARVDHWKLDQPHAPYLAMMAVGEFKKVTDEPWNGKEVSYYVEKDYEPWAREMFGDTREMINFFSTRLGVPFPWSKYAQIVVRDYVSGAMENTSATLHGDFVVYQTHRDMMDGKKGTAVIAHELFHQWFGDLVTCESWSNLPLNESFATYGEYLWEEYKNGREEADHHSYQSRQGYIHSQKEANLIRYDYQDKEDMFDGISYNKGGQVLHMLRKAVGDSAFFASLRNYLETNRNKPVEIHHLRLAFEEVTGRDMNWFFNQWFLNQGRPNLKISAKKNQGSIELTVEQNQDLAKYPLYRLPVSLDVYADGKSTRHQVEITEARQTFTFPFSGNFQLLNFDAERQLLADIRYEKSAKEYFFQYDHAPLYGDRLEVLQALSPDIADSAVHNLFLRAAKQDRSPHLRIYALGKLEKVGPDKAENLKAGLIDVYQNDKISTVRAKALNVLNKRFGVDQDIKDLNEKALSEPSYAICGEALTMISKHNPQMALQRAKQFEKESGKDILFPVATLYSNHGGDDQIQFFHESMKWLNGFELMGFCGLYGKAAKRCNDPAAAITAAQDLQYISVGANKYVKAAAVAGIKAIQASWENREKTAQSKLDALRQDNKPSGEQEKTVKEATETREILNKLYDKTIK